MTQRFARTMCMLCAVCILPQCKERIGSRAERIGPDHPTVDASSRVVTTHELRIVKDSLLGSCYTVELAGNPEGFLVSWQPTMSAGLNVAPFDTSGNATAVTRMLVASGGGVMNLIGLSNGIFGLFSATGNTLVTLDRTGTTLVETMSVSSAASQGSEIYTATVMASGPSFLVRKLDGSSFKPAGTYRSASGTTDLPWLRSFAYVSGHPVFAGSVPHDGVRDNKLVAYIGQNDGTITPVEFLLGDSKSYAFYPKYLPLQIVETAAETMQVLWQDNAARPNFVWHLTTITTSGTVVTQRQVPYHRVATFGGHLVGLRWNQFSQDLFVDELLADGSVLASTFIGKADSFAHARIAVGGRSNVGVVYNDTSGQLHFSVYRD